MRANPSRGGRLPEIHREKKVASRAVMNDHGYDHDSGSYSAAATALFATDYRHPSLSLVPWCRQASPSGFFLEPPPFNLDTVRFSAADLPHRTLGRSMPPT